MELIDLLKKFDTDFNKAFNRYSNKLSSYLNVTTIEDAIATADEDTDFSEKIFGLIAQIVTDSYNLQYIDENITSDLLDIPWINDTSLRVLLNDTKRDIELQIADTLTANNNKLLDITSYLQGQIMDVDLLEKQLYPYMSYIDDKDNVASLMADARKGNKNAMSLLSVVLVSMIPLILGKMVSNTVKDFVKARYTRIANTESVRAYYEGLLRKGAEDDNIFGYKYSLSNIHGKFGFDICDIITNANVGYGKGIYPKNNLPKYPFHPHCLCTVTPVFKQDVKKYVNNKFNSDGILEYVSGLSADKKEVILKYLSKKKVEFENPNIRGLTNS